MGKHLPKESVSPYHWNDREKMKQDYEYLNRFEKRVLPVLAKEINRLTGVDLNQSSWKIIAGPWLGYSLHIVFDRWYMLQEEKRKDSDLVIAGTGKRFEAYPTMKEFSKVSRTAIWNQVLYEGICEELGIRVDSTIGGQIKEDMTMRKTDTGSSKRRRAKSIARQISGWVTKGEHYVASNYMSVVDKIRLFWFLRPIYIDFRDTESSHGQVDEQLRES